MVSVRVVEAVYEPHPDDQVLVTPDGRSLDELLGEPVRRLQSSLADVMDVEAHPERSPEEAMGLLREAMNAFSAETELWALPGLGRDEVRPLPRAHALSVVEVTE